MNTKKKKLFKLFCVRVTKVGKLEKLQLNYKHLGEAKNFLNTIWKNAKTFLSTFFFLLLFWCLKRETIENRPQNCILIVATQTSQRKNYKKKNTTNIFTTGNQLHRKTNIAIEEKRIAQDVNGKKKLKYKT